MNVIGHFVFVNNDEIHVVLVENGSWYNKICIKPIEILKGNHFNGFKTVFVNSGAKKFIVVDLNAKVLMNLILRTPFHDVITTKSVPPYPTRDPLKPLRGAIITYVQPIIPYSRPFRRSLNYLTYKKNFNLDAHVQTFKVVIKATNEMVDEEITNMFKFYIKRYLFD